MQEKLGAKIKRLRKLRGLTQDGLAEAVGLSGKRVIYDYETGRISPSLEVLKKISVALDCDFILDLIPKK